MNPSSARLAALAIALALAVWPPASRQATRRPPRPRAAPPPLAAAARDQVAAQITGAGATFIYPLISKWSDDYNKATGAKVNYQSIGSGGGIAQIKAGTVDFGSSDKPMSSDELAAAGLGQFPSAIGGVVPVANLEGIEAGKLRLTGPLLADIFLGKVPTWNDPAIAALNPGVALPATKINIVHRSDGSGTTFNFTNYLTKVSPEWQAKIGEGTSVKWPGGVGGKGNEGVASYVKQIKGSIGYVELAYALAEQDELRLAAERRRQLGAAQRQVVPGRCLRRRLEEREGLQPGHHQRLRRRGLADRRHQLHPDVQAAQGRQAQRRHARLLQVGVRERPEPGPGARLRTVAAGTGAAGGSVLGSGVQVTFWPARCARLCQNVIPAQAGIHSAVAMKSPRQPHRKQQTGSPLMRG